MGPTGGHSIVQLHPTRRCNLRCLHCYSQSGPEVTATTPLPMLRGLIEDAVDLGYGVVGVSGGEPLLYPDLAELLLAAKDLGCRTTVTTNGMLLTDRRLAELAGLVDVLAISLDGTPPSHDRMRGNPRAFSTLDRRMASVSASGIPFGFISTLTMENVAELEFVVEYAVSHGASLVQVHPLELVGAAAGNLPDAIPDDRELAFGLLEGARLSLEHEIPVQVDVVRKASLASAPERFLATPPAAGAALGEWLTPLVVETDGTVVPLTYGMSKRFALGNLADAPLSRLADAWDPAPFLALCARVADDLLSRAEPFFSWYEEITTAAAAGAPTYG